MVPSQILPVLPNSKQLAPLFQLGRDFCTLIPSERETQWLYLWKGIQRAEMGRWSQNPFSFLGNTPYWLSHNRWQPVLPLGEPEILIRKKLLGTAAVKTVTQGLIIWSNPAEMIERPKESSRNLAVMSHSSFLTAWLRIMMPCLLSQWLVVL